LKDQADGFRLTFYCGKLTPFVGLTNVSQDFPFTLGRWMANSVVADFVVSGVETASINGFKANWELFLSSWQARLGFPRA